MFLFMLIFLFSSWLCYPSIVGDICAQYFSYLATVWTVIGQIDVLVLGLQGSSVFCLLSCCIIVHVSVIDYLCWCCLCTGRRLHHPRQPARERQNLNNQHLRAQQRPRKKNDIRNGLWRPYASQGGEGHALLRHIIPCAVCLLVHASNFSMRMIGSMLIGHFCCFQERERYKEARFELLVLVRASSSSVRHVVFAGCASRASHLGATVLQYCSMLKQ